MRRIILAVVAVLAVVAMSAWALRQLEIDSCLDEGGRFNYDTRNCETK